MDVTVLNGKIVKSLQKLAQIDIDAWHAYDQAIKSIDDRDRNIREKLMEFQEDHDRHVTYLSARLRELGEEPPEFSRDFKGFLIEGFTALRSASGTDGALKAMKSNEEITNKNYREALDPDLPSDLRELIENNFDDEKRHLAYIERTIEQRAI